METNDTTRDRVRARDAAMRLLNRLTTGAAVSALVGVGLFGAVSAYTIPGTKTSSTAVASTTATSTSTSTSTSSGLQTSTTPVTSSTSSGVAVSGGS